MEDIKRIILKERIYEILCYLKIKNYYLTSGRYYTTVVDYEQHRIQVYNPTEYTIRIDANSWEEVYHRMRLADKNYNKFYKDFKKLKREIKKEQKLKWGEYYINN